MLTENSRKLWNRLIPLVVPPPMVQIVHPRLTMELSGRVLSGTIWAVAELWKIIQLRAILLVSQREVICDKCGEIDIGKS